MRSLAQAIALAALIHPSSAFAQSLEDSVAARLRHLLLLSQDAHIQVARNYSPYFGNAVFYRSVVRFIDAPGRYAALIYAHDTLIEVRSARDLTAAWHLMHPPEGLGVSLYNACPQLLILTGVVSDNASIVRHKDDLPKHLLSHDSFSKASKHVRPPLAEGAGDSETLSYFVWDGWSLLAITCTLQEASFGVQIDTLATLPGA